MSHAISFPFSCVAGDVIVVNGNCEIAVSSVKGGQVCICVRTPEGVIPHDQNVLLAIKKKKDEDFPMPLFDGLPQGYQPSAVTP
jgi:sRNA-binding carbon storage regulator CsrA